MSFFEKLVGWRKVIYLIVFMISVGGMMSSLFYSETAINPVSEAQFKKIVERAGYDFLRNDDTESCRNFTYKNYKDNTVINYMSFKTEDACSKYSSYLELVMTLSARGEYIADDVSDSKHKLLTKFYDNLYVDGLAPIVVNTEYPRVIEYIGYDGYYNVMLSTSHVIITLSGDGELSNRKDLLKLSKKFYKY